jgi:hypothetical protein
MEFVTSDHSLPDLVASWNKDGGIAPMRTRTISLATVPFELALVALLTIFWISDAHGQGITESLPSGTAEVVNATPGSTANVSFTFNFGASSTVTSFDYELDFDPNALALDTVSVSSGTSIPFAELQSSLAGQFSPFATESYLSNNGLGLDAMGNLGAYAGPVTAIGTVGCALECVSAVWLGTDPNTLSPTELSNLSGTSTLTYGFTVLSTADAGNTLVTASIDNYSGADPSSYYSPSGETATVSVGNPTAAPEFSGGANLAIALTLLAGCLAVLRGRQKPKS